QDHALGPGDGQAQVERPTGVETGLGKDAEQAGGVELRGADDGRGVEALVAQFEEQAVLRHGQPGRLAAGYEVVIDDGVAPGGADPPQVPVFEIARHGRLVLGVAEYGAADARRVQVGDVDVGED